GRGCLALRTTILARCIPSRVRRSRGPNQLGRGVGRFGSPAASSIVPPSHASRREATVRNEAEKTSPAESPGEPDMWDEAGRDVMQAQELAAEGKHAAAEKLLGEARSAYNGRAQERVVGYDSSGEDTDVAISGELTGFLDSTMLEG